MPDHRLFTEFRPRRSRVRPLVERIDADFRRELARLDALLGRRSDIPLRSGSSR